MSISVDYVRFESNYIWIIKKGSESVVIDPGSAAAVKQYYSGNQLSLEAILITHYHSDHIAGLADLIFPSLEVYGPAYEPIHYVTRRVKSEDKIKLLDETFEVFFVPGHTNGHIAYYTPGHLFCGDLIFSGGCGRVFEGTAKTMYSSIQKCAQLPKDTKIYGGHEYTVSNLEFARMVEPKNKEIEDYYYEVKAATSSGKPSLPTTLAKELAINPFLRCDQEVVKKRAEEHEGKELADAAAVFSSLRHWKNRF
ncbi:hydroxyacylglutathione hydrolase [Candidatus Marinamargulisbacteria bacterium SCGC AG-414-C22]|nr:hydroxyacylglutathione hydrolase [Candidatus Marinamargulisbacteria bacterium SCGC AG-414-C22]